MQKEVLGIGRGYLLAFLIVIGFIAMIMILIAKSARMPDVVQFAEIYTAFAVPILAVVLAPKAIEKIGTAWANRKNGGTE